MLKGARSAMTNYKRKYPAHRKWRSEHRHGWATEGKTRRSKLQATEAAREIRVRLYKPR